MARFSAVSKGWKITAIVCLLLLLAVIGVCISAGVISVQEHIGFFEALTNMWHIGKTGGGEVVEDTEQTITAMVNLIR